MEGTLRDVERERERRGREKKEGTYKTCSRGWKHKRTKRNSKFEKNSCGKRDKNKALRELKMDNR